MPFQCPDCKTTLSTPQGVQPKFCSNCGSSLSTVTATTPDLLNDETMTVQPQRQATPSIVYETTPEAPQKIGPFIIGDQLGQGGMGVVYSARHEETDRMVAIKILPGHIFSEDLIERFKREGQIAASISHPRSTFIYEAGEHDGQLYIAMELMGGGTLKDVVREEGPLPVNRAVDFILDMIDGLRAAHRVGVIHRDLKPSNCFVDEDGRVKIGDYGLSKSVIADTAGLTQTGAFMGTPQFAAPEQIKSSELDERTDIYAIGCTLFYLLTGQPPFAGNAAQVIASIASDRAPRLVTLDKTIPRELDRVVSQTLEKDPDKRPVNLLELREFLLPYSSSGASMANVGRRMAAFIVDIAITSVSVNVLATMLTMFFMFSQISLSDAQRLLYAQISAGAIQILFTISYFAILESRYGKTIGKWLMGVRVVGANSESPHFGRALLRSSILPGLTWMLSIVPPLIWNALSLEAFSDNDLTDMMIRSQIFSTISWLPLILCCISMRASNGLRGIHEFISGTRTVELAGAVVEKRLENVPVTVASSSAPREQNRFTVQGTLGARENGNIEFGQDTQLERNVWMFANCELIRNDRKRLMRREDLSRPTRLRMLHYEAQEQELVVFEAIRGAPILEVIQNRRNTQWQNVRSLLSDLATELSQAVEDETLPDFLQTDQVWVTESGELKLLDCPLRKQNSPRNETTDQTSSEPEARAVSLLRDIMEGLIDRIVLPGHIIDYYRDLLAKDRNLKTLQWSSETLRDSSAKPSKWTWDDRTAVLGTSFGVECGATYTTGVIASLALGWLLPGLAYEGLTLFWFLSFCLLIWLGWHFRGGPVFGLAGVEVRTRKDMQPASRWRCALRTAIVWLPVSLALYTLVVQIRINIQSMSDPPSIYFSVGLTLISIVAWFTALSGGLFSIFNPARGIQDFLVGTILVRR
jgi:serine/threonine protein kinase